MVHLDKEEQIRSGQGRLTQLERGAIWSITGLVSFLLGTMLIVFLQEILLYERIDRGRVNTTNRKCNFSRLVDSFFLVKDYEVTWSECYLEIYFEIIKYECFSETVFLCLYSCFEFRVTSFSSTVTVLAMPLFYPFTEILWRVVRHESIPFTRLSSRNSEESNFSGFIKRLITLRITL